MAPVSDGACTFEVTDSIGRSVLRFQVEIAPEERRRLAHTRTGVQSMLDVLQRASAQEHLREHDALAVARVRGLRIQRDALTAEGGTLSASEVAGLLGLTRQAVDLRRANGKLLALDLGVRRNLYPRWQFTAGGVLAGLEETLGVLREDATPPWSCVRFFLTDNVRLRDERPLDRLRRGDTESVLMAARAFDHQGAA